MPPPRPIPRSEAGIRRVLAGAFAALALCAAALSAFAVAGWTADGGWPWQAVVSAAAAAGSLAALWAAYTICDRMFDGIERLRGDLVVARAAGGSLPPRWATAGETEAELRRLAGAVSDLLAELGEGRARPDGRLEAVVASAAEGLVVVTETGLVSLVNGAARKFLAPNELSPGTSLFGAIERESFAAAAARARALGRPVRARLATAGGGLFVGRLADLGEHAGVVLSLPGAETDEHAPGISHDLGLHDAPPPAAGVRDDTLLSALPAVVLDSETTGLSVREDRVVSLGAVRVHGPRVFRHLSLDLLVNPGRPIPPRATAVHGIGDAMVAGAPGIAEALARLEGFAAGTALVGHNIGFDLAILREEVRRGGGDWTPPPSLDTGHLYAALEPAETELDLELIAGRLGIPVEGRHTALGDALVAASVFVRLLPLLADRGVATFGEARAFAATARRLRRPQADAGWILPGQEADRGT